jgi:hypothetical protein
MKANLQPGIQQQTARLAPIDLMCAVYPASSHLCLISRAASLLALLRPFPLPQDLHDRGAIPMTESHSVQSIVYDGPALNALDPAHTPTWWRCIIRNAGKFGLHPHRRLVTWYVISCSPTPHQFGASPAHLLVLSAHVHPGTSGPAERVKLRCPRAGAKPVAVDRSSSAVAARTCVWEGG